MLAEPPAPAATRSWTGAVLAGGASTRMGTDKALLAVSGRPLAAIAAAALRGAGAARVLAVGGDGAALAGLGLEAVADAAPGEGPLAGILAALDAARTDVVVVLACDLPGVTAASVARVIAALDASPAAAVAWPEVDGHAHVLHAAWRSSRACATLAAAFATGERSPRRAAAPLARVVATGVDPAALRNANRPEDLR